MITSYEVGAIFKVVDEASANIRKITAEVRKLSAELKKVADQFKLVVPGNTTVDKIGALAAEWSKVATGMKEAAVAMADAAKSAETAAAATLRTERAGVATGTEGAVAADAAAIAAANAGVRGRSAAGRARRGPAHGGRGGFMRNIFGGGHFGLGLTHHGAHPRGHLPISPGTLGGAAIGYGIWKESELEDAVGQALWHSGRKDTPENREMFRNIIQQGAVATGFGYKEVIDSMLNELRLLQGTDQDIKEVLPEMLRSAGTEARLKGTGLNEAMKALVGITHMFQAYEPQQLKQLAPVFGYVSTLSPESLTRIENAASYAVPALMASGIIGGPGAADILYQVVAMQRAGMLSTKSGTNLRAALERALPPDPALVGKETYKHRIAGMRRLGLVDAQGRSRVIDPEGHLDIEAMLATVRAHAALLPLATRNATLAAVFGEQGKRGVGVLSEPKVMEQLARLKKEEGPYKERYGTFLDYYKQNSPIQQARVVFEQLTNVLADMGRIYLPPVVEGMKALDAVLSSLQTHLPKPVVTGIGWGGAIGAGIGGIAGMFGGPGGIIGGALLGLTAGSAIGAGVGSLFDTAPPVPNMPFAPSSSQPGGGTGSPVLPLTPEMTPWDTKKMNYLNTIPPGSGSGSTTGSVGDVFLDGRKVTEIVMGHMAQMGSGPNEGPPFVDGTNSAPAMDSSYAFG